jgi:hypothetical protein
VGRLRRSRQKKTVEKYGADCEVFNEMAKIERELNMSILMKKGKKGEKGERLFLDEMPESYGRFQENKFECGVLC